MQGVMSGQGAIAFGISIVQFLSALATGTGKTSNHDTEDESNTSEDEVVASTYKFLLVSLVFVFVAGLATNTLIKLPCYKHAMQRHKQLEESQQDEERISTGDNTTTHAHTPQLQHHKSSIWQVNRKIRNLGWSIAYIYTVTIGLFPSITSLVKSTSYKGPHDSSVSVTTFGHGVRDRELTKLQW